MARKQENNYTLEDEIRDAMAGKIPLANEEQEETEVVEEPEDVVADAEKQEVTEPQQETDAKEEVKEVAETVEPAPVSWSGAVKSKWAELPAEVRAEIKKREDDIHKAMTAQDGDLAVGRKIKEISAPYEAIIRSEGGTVEGAFRDLLNTAYILRTGSPQQKAQLVLQTAQQFGVDLRPYFGGQQPQQNNISALQQEIEYLRRNQVNPEQLKTQLQEEMEAARIQSEIQAFAANPAYEHFELVRPIMKGLLESGQARNLQEAYDSAIWSVPSIRTQLEAKAKAAEAEKKKAEMEHKKKAAASVTGSMGMSSPNTNAPPISLEEQLRENLQAARGQI